MQVTVALTEDEIRKLILKHIETTFYPKHLSPEDKNLILAAPSNEMELAQGITAFFRDNIDIGD